MPPTRREIAVSQLESEARELNALASMVKNNHVPSLKELREEYIPHRIERLKRVGDEDLIKRTQAQWAAKEEKHGKE